MLTCSCGWHGAALVPGGRTNTAHCPECGTRFDGIPAWMASTADAAPEHPELIDISAAYAVHAEEEGRRIFA